MFPITDDFEWDEDEDEREVARSRSQRWEPADDEVEAMIDFADFEED